MAHNHLKRTSKDNSSRLLCMILTYSKLFYLVYISLCTSEVQVELQGFTGFIGFAGLVGLPGFMVMKT